MNIYIGADHRGFELKERIKYWLQEQGVMVIDCGNATLQPGDDYPPFALAVAEKVVGEPGSLGIVICGSGVGVTIAANKVKGARCATAYNQNQVIHGRESDDMNILALESDYLSLEVAQPMIEAFMVTPFHPTEKAQRRLAQIAAYENQKA